MLRTRIERKTGLTALAGLLGLAAVACVGEVPTNEGGGDDDAPGVDAGDVPDPPDAGPEDPQALAVNGATMDYREGVAIPGVSLQTAGIVDSLGQPIAATSDLQGLFTFPDVPAASTFYVHASLDSLELDYRPTQNEPVVVTDQPLQQNLYIVSEAFVGVQAATAGVLVEPLTSIVITDLRAPDGTPMEGLPLADITLTNALGEPVGDGPYFFGALGDIDPGLLVSTAFGGKARVAFLNVPTGVHTLTALYPNPVDPLTPIPQTVSVTTIDDGANLMLLGATGGPPPQPGQASFENDVYPLLQRAAEGGDGCANCHRLGGVAAFLRFEEEPAIVLQNILGRPGVVDLLAPENSMLLSKPLYEDPPNHPNATYLDLLAPSYVLMMSWIEEGALP